MKTTTIIAIVLGVLVLISAVQAFQLNGLKAKVEQGQVGFSSGGSATPLASGAGSGSGVPPSLDDLPQMVGGC